MRLENVRGTLSLSMDERRKKLFFIALFIIAVVGIATVLYLLFFRALTPTSPIQTGPDATGNALPRAASGTPPIGTVDANGQLIPGSDLNPYLAGTPTLPENVLLPNAPRAQVIAQNIQLPIALTPGGGNSIRFYSENDGKFYSILDDGTRIPLSDAVFPNVEKVTWGNKSEKAVIGFPDGSQVIYDFGNDKQSTVPRFWQDLKFSPSDQQIVGKSLGTSPTNRFLIVADSDGSNPQPIEELGNNQDKVMVNWSPNNQVVAFSRTGESLGGSREQILLVGKNHENMKGLVVEGRGFLPTWSPNGSQLLYSAWTSENNYHPTLWISGASGDQVNTNRRRISIETWADKCVWIDETSILCGAPRNMPHGAGLQRALFDIGPDALYRMNISNGQVTEISGIGRNIVVKSIQVSSDGQTAFVVDGATGQLIKIRLGS